MRPLALVAAVGALLAAGCVTKHTGVDGQTSCWRRGVTTRRDVVAAWGNPDRIEGDVWIWKDWRLVGSRVKVAYMSIGFTVANAVASTRTARLSFDRDGRLASEEWIDSLPGGATWLPNPWR